MSHIFQTNKEIVKIPTVLKDLEYRRISSWKYLAFIAEKRFSHENIRRWFDQCSNTRTHKDKFFVLAVKLPVYFYVWQFC